MSNIPPDLVSRQEAVEKVLGWKYQTDDILLAPYVGNGIVDFPEDFLVSMYYRMRDQGLLGVVFAGMGTVTLNRFINYLFDKPMVVAVTKPTYNVAGFGWLFEVDGPEGARKATVGFSFFRESVGRPMVRSASRLAFRWWFEELKVDVLYGAILESNQIAVNFSEKLGFRSVSVIPKWFSRNGELVDARLVMLTKEDFLQREALNGRTVKSNRTSPARPAATAAVSS